MEDLIKSGIVEKCVKILGGDDDLTQDIYLTIIEYVGKKGQKWLDDKRANNGLGAYVYVMCRNRLMANNKSNGRYVPLFDGWHDKPDSTTTIDERMDFIDALDAVTESVSTMPEGNVLFRWMDTGSFRKLSADIEKRTGKRISHQTLYYAYRDIIQKIKIDLKKKGYKNVSDLWNEL